MKLLVLLTLFFSNLLWATCKESVLNHHRDVYHRTYRAANNTFLNNFVGRKNMFAHTFGYPELSFLSFASQDQNYIAADMLDKAYDLGKNERDLLDLYLKDLESGEICQKLGVNIKNPRKLRRYILDKLGNS